MSDSGYATGGFCSLSNADPDEFFKTKALIRNWDADLVLLLVVNHLKTGYLACSPEARRGLQKGC
jgi:hypothetical protein